MEIKEFKEIYGKVIKEVDVDKCNNEINFITECGENFKMYHDQDCCEVVYIKDITGCLNDLVGQAILLFEERTEEKKPDLFNTYTWTFYEIRTQKASVTIEWYGESNGYYSERVTFENINNIN